LSRSEDGAADQHRDDDHRHHGHHVEEEPEGVPLVAQRVQRSS